VALYNAMFKVYGMGCGQILPTADHPPPHTADPWAWEFGGVGRRFVKSGPPGGHCMNYCPFENLGWVGLG